jgi:transcription elongation factor Elf1
MELIALADPEETFRCWMCGQVKSVLDRVLDIDPAQVCGDCAEPT